MRAVALPHGLHALLEHVVVGAEFEVRGALDVVVSAPEVLHSTEHWGHGFMVSNLPPKPPAQGPSIHDFQRN